jgi:hypothetical protein
MYYGTGRDGESCSPATSWNRLWARLMRCPANMWPFVRTRRSTCTKPRSVVAFLGRGDRTKTEAKNPALGAKPRCLVLCYQTRKTTECHERYKSLFSEGMQDIRKP